MGRGRSGPVGAVPRALRRRMEHDAPRPIFAASFGSERFSVRRRWRRSERHAAQRGLGLDPARCRSVGRSGAALGPAEGRRRRDARADDRPVADLPTAAVGRLGDQPQIGGAVAEARAGGAVEPGAGSREGQETSACRDDWRRSDPRGVGVRCSLVIVYRPDRSLFRRHSAVRSTPTGRSVRLLHGSSSKG